ncbi:thermonuclease family protein [Aureimonas fodinaquatilis]|nr:thermonuclease family protein [Aureimonas fodinaquatilis]
MAFSALIALLICGGSAAAAPMQGPANAMDGDTIVLEGTQKFVRLFGIDAPELNQPCQDADNRPYMCGIDAAHFLQSLLAQAKYVRCQPHQDDSYGRIVAACSVNGIEIGAEMVRHGWALDYTKYSGGRFKALEASARQRKVGIWAGSFVEPYLWRRQNAGNPGQGSYRRCLVKGNISAAGKIYHIPGSKAYPKVRITPSKGERWFCSEREAQNAGWRPVRGESMDSVTEARHFSGQKSATPRPPE